MWSSAARSSRRTGSADKVCLKGGGEALGVLIGETSDRTYIGEPRGSKPRHIISIPESEVSRVIVGGHANDIRNAACH